MKNLEKIKLVPLGKGITKEVYQMYQEIPKEELGSKNLFNGASYKEFELLCKRKIKEETIINEELHTTTKIFLLFVEEKPIGEVGIRTTLNDFWVQKGSQIYYKIRPSQRGKGYGNLILKLALEKAKKMNFTSIRVNCDNRNIPSKKVIIKNGGKADILNYKTKDGYSTSYVISLKEE